ncbi:MAG: hypothetical protein WC654_00865 [Patescibacteria group bacterium]
MNEEDEFTPVETAEGVDFASFGSFQESSIEIDPATQYARCTVPLQHGVRQITELPVPVLCAWALDNIAGKLLAEAGKLKA